MKHDQLTAILENGFVDESIGAFRSTPESEQCVEALSTLLRFEKSAKSQLLQLPTEAMLPIF